MIQTAADLKPKVQQLLNEIQQEFPLDQRPFEILGKRAGMDEAETLDAMREVKDAGMLRQISAIFDTRSLGYASSLVAARVPEADLDKAAEIIGRHPGVSHNYARKHDFNLWFTIAVPAGSSLQEHVDLLKVESGAEAIRLLPTLKLFKIGMKLDTTFGKNASSGAPAYSEKHRKGGLPPVTERDRAFVRVMQEDLELCAEPFAAAAKGLGVRQDELFAWCRAWQAQGRIRRVAGILNHRKAGFEANGMGVWAVPEARTAEVGALFAAEPAVTHCYLRPTYPDWRYNVFTMVHADDTGRCEEILRGMSERCGVADYGVLYSYREFKKVRQLYFTGAIARWELAHGLTPGAD